MVAPVSERFQFVPSENARIAEPAAPSETKTSVPAPASEADGAVATVYVGTWMSPTKPFVDVTGPLKVVEAILVPLAQGFAMQSVQRQVGRDPVCKANVAPRAE
jgi:hypothetical protein